ncbi:MAG: hypothetical protein H7Y86_11425 [Rhizobacter sp.]|nr:hypothetical protein [Ferruginibacter sp.]
MAEVLDKKKGADTVLITDYFAPVTAGTSINTVSKTDITANGSIQTGTTFISPIGSK